MASGKVDKIPHIEEIGSSGVWSWILYDDKTVDLYLKVSCEAENYTTSSFGGLYLYGPAALPFELATGYSFIAGCKIGNGLGIIALCNAISGTQISIVGQSNGTGNQSCDFFAHLHGKKA